MEPVFMVLAQSSAVAASLAIDNKCDVQEVCVSDIKRLLDENPYSDREIYWWMMTRQRMFR